MYYTQSLKRRNNFYQPPRVVSAILQMCKAGLNVPEVSPGIVTPVASENSSAQATYIKDTVQTYVDITITSGAALLIGIIILLIAILVIHQIHKSAHRDHHRRLDTLASLAGFGADNIGESRV